MRTPRGAVRARCGRTLSALAVLAGRCAALLRGLARSAAGVWMSRSMADRKAASVLPDPVGAMTSAFSPRRIAVQARSWTDVGPSGKAEANQVRVAGAKPFSADPGGPVGSTGPGGPVGPAGSTGPGSPVGPADPAGPIGSGDSSSSASPADPGTSAGPADPAGSADSAGPIDPGAPASPAGSAGPTDSVRAGSAGSPLLAVRALMPSPAFLIVPSSCARLAHGSHPTSALHAACSPQPASASHSHRSRPPRRACTGGVRRVGIRQAELRHRGSGQGVGKVGFRGLVGSVV